MLVKINMEYYAEDLEGLRRTRCKQAYTEFFIMPK